MVKKIVIDVMNVGNYSGIVTIEPNQCCLGNDCTVRGYKMVFLLVTKC